MRLPLTLLRRRLSGTWTLEEVGSVLARSPLELEGVERHAPGMERVVTGRILEALAHSDADRLRVCQVDMGAMGAVQIVTAATNVQAGDTVPVALDGAVLPTGKAILSSKMRGVLSQGMFCSVEELGVSLAAEGVWVLPEETSLGFGVAEAMDLGEVVLLLAVPAHRGDLLSAHGVARELASLGLGELVPLPASDKVTSTSGAAVELGVMPEGVEAYSAQLIEELDVVPPSDPEVARVLLAAGLRPVDAVVDVTNMMMLEFGQPMHAFDASKVRGGRVRVREAQAGEELRLLDGRDVRLRPIDLVIADDVGALALAGVMGGAESSVGPSTRSLLIEVAVFDPARVRATAIAHQAVSESSQRFARGVDGLAISGLLAEAVRRIILVAGGRAGAAVTAELSAPPARCEAIGYRPERTRRLLGVSLDDKEQLRALARMGAQIEDGAPAWRVTPPSWRRRDVWREVDLVEEVAFQNGLDAVPALLPAAELPVDVIQPDVQSLVRRWATAQGLDEVMLPSLVPAGRDDIFTARTPVDVAEPMGEFQVLRRSLWPGLLELALKRRREGADRCGLFELGRVAWRQADGVREESRFAALLAGSMVDGPWLRGPESLAPDVRWGQGLLNSLVASLVPGALLEWRSEPLDGLQPGRTAVAGDSAEFVAAEVHPDVLDAMGLGGWSRVVLLEARVESNPRRRPAVGFKVFDRHPAARRDLSLLVDEGVTAAELGRVIRETASDRLREMRVFDRYSGPGVPEGKASVAVALAFGASERTLKEVEVEAIEGELLKALEEKLGARRRS